MISPAVLCRTPPTAPSARRCRRRGCPASAEREISEASSSGERAERSSSCGSMPSAPHDRVGRAVEHRGSTGRNSRGEAALEAAGWPAPSPSAGRSRGSSAPARRRPSSPRSRAPARPITADGRTPCPRAPRRPQRAVDQVGDRRLGQEADRRLVIVMPTWAPDSWVDSERSAAQHAARAARRRPRRPARPWPGRRSRTRTPPRRRPRRRPPARC